MPNPIPEVLDQTLARQHCEMIEMPVKLWNQVHQAAEMDNITFDAYVNQHMAAVVQAPLRREAECRRRAAAPKPDGRLRFPGGIR